MRVLIVDDNHNVSTTVAEYLEIEGICIDCAYHGKAALNMVSEYYYDVIIMDIMMPKMDGVTTVKIMREELACKTPIIFLTAKDHLDDKVLAFKAGGDDYLLKPFSMQELSLRIRALANRGPLQNVGNLVFADITIHSQTNQVERAGKPLKLSRIQIKILKLLVRQAPAIVSKQAIMSEIWGDEPPDSDALRSHIYALRTSLEKGFKSLRLETIHGEGYRLKL